MNTQNLPAPRLLKVIGLLLASAATATAQIIYIDFGEHAQTAITGWNNVSSRSSTGIPVLVDSTGANTSVSLAITNGFTDASNTSQNTTGFGDYPASATTDFLASSKANGSGEQPVLTFSGLDPAKSYTFTIFASRSSGAGTRMADYTFSNDESSSADNLIVSLDAGSNVNNTVTMTGFAPSAAGVITLSLSRGEGNTSGYVYINAMTITGVSNVPEPSTYAILSGMAGLGCCAMRRRRR